MGTNVTRAAEGFDRRSFTVAEILRMQDAGIIAEDENFELIEGEIVPMQAKTHVHERIKVGVDHRNRPRAAGTSLDGGGIHALSRARTPSLSPIWSFIRMVSSLRT